MSSHRRKLFNIDDYIVIMNDYDDCFIFLLLFTEDTCTWVIYVCLFYKMVKR